MPAESFHTQHAPFGAFASFTIGLVGSTGGFGQSLRGPGRQNVYVGCRRGRAPWKMLPFFTPPQSQVSAYTAGVAPAPDLVHAAPVAEFTQLGADGYVRKLTWAGDVWTSGAFQFGLRSPFDRIPDPDTLSVEANRFHFAPAVCGFISYDNSAGTEPVELMFGIGEPDAQMRPLDAAGMGLAGFAGGTSFGFATAASPSVETRQGFSVFNDGPKDYRGLQILGGETALVFTVPAGAKKEFPLVLGFFQRGIVTTGIDASYAYARWFGSVEDVLQFALINHARYTALAAQRDRELAASKLSADQQFLVAQASHSYRGSTELLDHEGKLLWVVNEGEYRMMNTFDLTVDHVFFELEWHPWAVRNALDLFRVRYSFTDEVVTPEGVKGEGGLSFTHDMGIMDHFTPSGHSSYECDGIAGCFSHMTMEQLLNWVLTAVTYAWRTGDNDWLARNRSVLVDCVSSLERRDHPDPAKRDGILKCDTTRCRGGSEITTYDSLDVSLGQARNNLYLAVKTLGAWLLLAQAFTRLKDDASARRSQEAVERLTRSLQARFENETGFFPAVFEKNNRSRIIPAVEGFAYPLFLGMEASLVPLAPLIECLRRHLKGVLRTGVCIDAVSGGWKLSSTSRNTWFSKIALSQYVVRKMFPDTLSPEAKAADRVHADWQRTPGCGASAMCDQILSDTGMTCGSRYYPRGVTAWLWMLE